MKRTVSLIILTLLLGHISHLSAQMLVSHFVEFGLYDIDGKVYTQEDIDDGTLVIKSYREFQISNPGEPIYSDSTKLFRHFEVIPCKRALLILEVNGQRMAVKFDARYGPHRFLYLIFSPNTLVRVIREDGLDRFYIEDLEEKDLECS